MIAICKSVFNSKIDFTGNLSHTWSREWFISALPFSNLKILGEILFFQRIFNMMIISILDREKNTAMQAVVSWKLQYFLAKKHIKTEPFPCSVMVQRFLFLFVDLGHHRQSPFIPLMVNAWTLGSTENAKSSRSRGIMPFKRWFRWIPNTNLRQITSKDQSFRFFSITISSNCSILFYSEQTSNDQSEW